MKMPWPALRRSAKKNFKISVKSVDVQTAQISELPDDGKEREAETCCSNNQQKTYATIFY